MAVASLQTKSEGALYPLHYEAYCVHCHKSLGHFDGDELSYLINDAPLGCVLCFDCEEARLREIQADVHYPILSSAIRELLVLHGLV